MCLENFIKMQQIFKYQKKITSKMQHINLEFKANYCDKTLCL